MMSQEVQGMDCGPVSEPETVIAAVYTNGVHQRQDLGCLHMQPGVHSVYIHTEMDRLVELASGLPQKARHETVPESVHCELFHPVCQASLQYAWGQQLSPTPPESFHSQSGMLCRRIADMPGPVSPGMPTTGKEKESTATRAFELLQPARMLLCLQQQQQQASQLDSTLSQDMGERTWGNPCSKASTQAMPHLDTPSLGQVIGTTVEGAVRQIICQPTSLIDAAEYVEIKTLQSLPVDVISEGLGEQDFQAGQTEPSCEKHQQDMNGLRKENEIYTSVCYADDNSPRLQSDLSCAILSTATAGTSQRQPAASPFAEMYLHASQLLCELSETVAASKKCSEIDPHKVEVSEPDIKSGQADRPHQCIVCKAGFRKQSHLRGHMLSHSSCRTHKCPDCRAGFKRQSDLNCHRMAAHSHDRQFRCRQSPPGRKKGVLRTKSLTYNSRKDQQCSKCKVSFKTQYLLKKHSLIHVGENCFQCRESKSSFKRMADLKHRRQIHGETVKSSSPAARKTVTESQTHQTVTPCSGASLNASQLLSELSETAAATGRTSRLRQKKLKPVASGERPHTCKVCAASFKLPSHLKAHLVVHSSARPYKCNVCKFAFKKKYLLKNHMVVHSSDRPYRCNDCNGTFKRFKDVRSHRLIHCKQRKHDLEVIANLDVECQREPDIVCRNGIENSLAFSIETVTGVEVCDGAYQCSECKAAFNQVSLLKSHVLSHASERPYHCTECKSGFGTAADLNRHRAASHRDERHHECAECRATFKTKSLLKNHITWVHSNERPYQCTDCTAAFKTKSRLKSHSLIHSSDRPYRCSLCQAAFKKAIYLRGHMQSHSDVRPFQCSECDSSFKRFQDLKFHKMIHSGEKPYTCNECGLAFRKLGYLKSHTLIHSDDKPFKCSECQAAFKRSAALKFHRLVHGDDKPYRCSECNAAFNRLAQLNEHKVFHTGDAPVRPYQCSECKAAFKSSFDLKKHMNTHSTERQHQCMVCQGFFKSMFTLRNHMITHSDRRPYQCTQCDAAFKTLYRLKKHTLVHINTREEKTAQRF